MRMQGRRERNTGFKQEGKEQNRRMGRCERRKNGEKN